MQLNNKPLGSGDSDPTVVPTAHSEIHWFTEVGFVSLLSWLAELEPKSSRSSLLISTVLRCLWKFKNNLKWDFNCINIRTKIFSAFCTFYFLVFSQTHFPSFIPSYCGINQ